MSQRLLGGVSFIDDAQNPGRVRDAAHARRLRLRAATQGLPARVRSKHCLLHSGSGSGGPAEQFGRTEKSFKFRTQKISAFFNAGARLADASQAYRACPNLINSHTQMGGNHLDKKRDEIKTKSL